MTVDQATAVVNEALAQAAQRISAIEGEAPRVGPANITQGEFGGYECRIDGIEQAFYGTAPGVAAVAAVRQIERWAEKITGAQVDDTGAASLDARGQFPSGISKKIF